MLDVILTLHADHELNASTFAARVAVATLADLHAAVVAAISTLKGPRHGGANDDVLAMLQEIGDPARVEAYVDGAHRRPRPALPCRARRPPRAHARLRPSRLQGGRRAGPRAPRHGHATWRTATGRTRLFEVAEAVYASVTRRTGLPVNVDFFSAVVYDALGIPPDFCTSIFATGRVAGWCAHALEQFADNRLIRPRAHFIGPRAPAPRPLIPVEGWPAPRAPL